MCKRCRPQSNGGELIDGRSVARRHRCRKTNTQSCWSSNAFNAVPTRVNILRDPFQLVHKFYPLAGPSKLLLAWITQYLRSRKIFTITLEWIRSDFLNPKVRHNGIMPYISILGDYPAIATAPPTDTTLQRVDKCIYWYDCTLDHTPVHWIGRTMHSKRNDSPRWTRPQAWRVWTPTVTATKKHSPQAIFFHCLMPLRVSHPVFKDTKSDISNDSVNYWWIYFIFAGVSTMWWLEFLLVCSSFSVLRGENVS